MTDKMTNALNHIKTSVDVDPWAVEEVERVFNAIEDIKAEIIHKAESNGSDYDMEIGRAYGLGQAEMMAKINSAKAEIINYMVDEGFGSEYIDGVIGIINKRCNQ